MYIYYNATKEEIFSYMDDPYTDEFDEIILLYHIKNCPTKYNEHLDYIVTRIYYA